MEMDVQEHAAREWGGWFLVFTSWEPLRPWLALEPSAEWPDPAATWTTSYDRLLIDQP